MDIVNHIMQNIFLGSGAVAASYIKLPDVYNHSKAYEACVSRGGHLPTMVTRSDVAEVNAFMSSNEIKKAWVGVKKQNYSHSRWITESTGHY